MLHRTQFNIALIIVSYYKLQPHHQSLIVMYFLFQTKMFNVRSASASDQRMRMRGKYTVHDDTSV